MILEENMKILAAVADVGVNYKVISILEGDESVIFEHQGVKYYDIPSVDLKHFIEQSMVDGKEVFFPKGIDYPLTKDDLIIQDIPDPIAAERQGSSVSAKHFIAYRIGYLSMFDFFNFQILNNKLAAAGYVISDSNREEKYLEIVNTGEQDLISVLEEYLALLDKLSEHNFIYKQWLLFNSDLQTATSVEQVRSMTDNFRSQFS